MILASKRYWQPSEDIPDATATDIAKVSSSDPILTAFAQLGALRLSAKRGMITLVTREHEYIIAEAGKTLSIQGDNDEQDRLWHGVATIRSRGLGHDLVKLFCDPNAPQYQVFTDVTKVEFLKDRKFVIESPFVRFFACVPLRTPGGMVIGCYMVADDAPRDGLNDSEMQFMTDIGVTVMDYLEAGRVKQKQYRAERMVKAMGLFIEGKATLREWWLQVGHYSQNAAVRKRTQHEIPLEKQADLEFGVQDPVDEFTAKGLNGLHPHDTRPTLLRSPSSSTLSHSVHGDPKTDGRPIMPQRDSMFSTSTGSTPVSRSWHERNSSVTTFDAVTVPTVETEERHHSVAFDLPPDNVGPDASKELQEVLFSGDLKGVFARASNLIREAISVDGVLFLDASIGSFGGSADREVMEEKAPGSFDAEKLTMSSDDDPNGRRPSEPEISADAVQEVATQQNGNPAEKPEKPEKHCSILGFSTRRRSSLRGHAPYEEHKQFPEAVLRRLLKRYPHGKVLNFEEDGSFSSSDTDHTLNGYSDADATPQTPGAHERKAQRKRLSREAEAKAILSVLPKARSVFWFPLWDQSKERWFSGSLVWSTTPTRVFCPVEDLTYLAAFGNSVMAEVSRLSAQVLAQMKTDFISSISHELRSPLHGVLASVEFLQETSLSEVQTDMVYNIQASAKVLLDTLNHVLDFSKVNRKSKNKGLSPAFRSKRSKKAAARADPERQSLDNTVEDIADVCVLSEEVVESIYAGRSINKRAFDSAYRQKSERPQSMALDSPITVIMDVNYHPSWKFEIDAGAWRRILMNLFNNALKYTKAGFVQVSLHVESDALSRTKKSRSILTLKVKDSGKGISQEFLKHRMFKPFTQEDSLAAGAGLGLSIVRHIVHDLGGEINFVSEQGAGTEATVRIPLTPILGSKTAEQEQLAETRNETRGLKFSLEGFDRYPDISETPTGILSSETEAAMLLKASVNDLMSEWFEMEAATSATDKSTADIVVIMGSGFGGKSVSEILQTYHCSLSPVAAKSIAIVFSTNYHTGSKIHSQGRFKIFYLPQP
jgi:signal transduction histidine kinase